jgi:hypothetical protein
MDAAPLDAQIHRAHRNKAGELLGQLLGYEDRPLGHSAPPKGPASTSSLRVAMAAEPGFIARASSFRDSLKARPHKELSDAVYILGRPSA